MFRIFLKFFDFFDLHTFGRFSQMAALKELNDSHRQKSGIVYKMSYTQCNFVHYRQTKMSLTPEMWTSKKQGQVLTRTLKLQALFTFSAII